MLMLPKSASVLNTQQLHPRVAPVGQGVAGQQLDEEFSSWRAKHPCILQHFDTFLERVNGKRVAVFLDYDGTLTPIVNNPDQAIMSPQMRDTVRQVAHLFPTAIISGRGRDKVEAFVQLPELFYAGSHGMDIAGPRGEYSIGTPHNFQAAAEFRPLIDQLYHDLCERLQDIPGASVEHNNFCVSAHFRNCATENWQRVVLAVNDSVAAQPTQLHVTRGRKVLEVRPQVDWDKGRALLHLLEVLGLQEQADVLPIYIGDDKTDEDAFKALQGPNNGVGILVSTKVKPTAAAFTVRDPDEVAAFLKMLVQFGTSCANGWWNHQDACNGWAPAHLRHSISAPAGLVMLGGRRDSSSQPSTPHSQAAATATQVQAAVAAAVIRPAAEAAAHHRLSLDEPGMQEAAVASAVDRPDAGGSAGMGIPAVPLLAAVSSSPAASGSAVAVKLPPLPPAAAAAEVPSK